MFRRVAYCYGDMPEALESPGYFEFGDTSRLISSGPRPSRTLVLVRLMPGISIEVVMSGGMVSSEVAWGSHAKKKAPNPGLHFGRPTVRTQIHPVTPRVSF